MKPHTAALALAAWYLLAPPVSKNGALDTSASLSAWEQFGAFDTADACEKASMQLNECAAVLRGKPGNVVQACGGPVPNKPIKNKKKQDAVVKEVALQVLSAECISTDDPRLKKK